MQQMANETKAACNKVAEEEKVQYNEIISELKQVTSDAQLTAGKYGVDLATGIIKNNFRQRKYCR